MVRDGTPAFGYRSCSTEDTCHAQCRCAGRATRPCVAASRGSRTAPPRSNSRWSRRRSGADVRHHGNRAGVLRRPDAGNRGRRSARLIMTGQAQTQGFSQASSRTRSATQDLRPVRLRQRRLRRRQDLYRRFARDQQHAADRRNGKLDTSNFAYHARRARRHRRGAAASTSGRSTCRCSASISPNLGGNKRLLMATAAFRNEPYQ